MGTGEAQPRAAELIVGRRWTFGPAVLDERSLELTVKGELARVERKPLEVLLYLLHHAGEVVTKDELADNLWPGRILTETVLTRCISQLRQVLKDEERSVIRTVHGYGYRLVTEVKVDATTAPAPPAFSFKPGQHPPLRPHWLLVERLGTGGHGEAWLAQQDKTRDQRVFKFALDAGGLTALKREITLYRLLNDTLGDRAPAVRLLEWNLQEAPYFIETEYVEGRDLSAWATARGGLAGMPLEPRLDLIAQVAEALAVAHSVGVLHKDLKPGNVLVNDIAGRPTVRLSDFGSGGVLDAERLEKLGITRLGFTKTATKASATPLYVAPEVVAGQPSTVSADIYALGVMLYQIVVGDFRKALAPGWELDVSDELLREDIAVAAAGDPSRRLADAAKLAERLRTLESRREARAAEMAARERAERARRALEQLRRARLYASVLLALVAIAALGGVTAYRARNDAVAATATAEAVSDFLMEDVLRMDSGLFKPSEASYEALLDRAAREVGIRLRNQPKAAADIHWLLGRRYQEIGRFDAATQQYEQAVALFTDLYGRSADATLMALERLAWVYLETGRNAEMLVALGEMRKLWESRLRSTDLTLLMVRTRIARTLMTAGAYSDAEKEFRAVVQEAPAATVSAEDTNVLFKEWFGVVLPSQDAAPQVLAAYANTLLAGHILEELGNDYQEAESRLSSSRAALLEIWGQDNELSAHNDILLAIVLASRGKYQEAEQTARRAETFLDHWLPGQHFARSFSSLAMGRIRLEQRRYVEATNLFKRALELCSQHRGCPPRVRANFLADFGRACHGAGRYRDAVESLREALAVQETLGGSGHANSVRIRISLADALRNAGSPDEAGELLKHIEEEPSAELRRYAKGRADLRRVEGLLFLSNGDFVRANTALRESLDIVSHRVGLTHWRTQRAQAEHAQVPERYREPFSRRRH